MSTLAFIPQAELTADTLTDDRLLEILSTNPEALLDLIYGPSRRIKNAAPPHDHDEDGGEPHHLPLLQHSFGQYFAPAVGLLGIPLGPPAAATSYAVTTTDGVTDYTQAKRLHCAMILIPGGVSELRVSLTEYHETTGKDVILYVALRSLSSVNFKLGVAPEEVRAALNYTTSGSPGTAVQSVTIADLSPLGDPTQDREVEASLWLACDLDTTTVHQIFEWEIVATDHTDAARDPAPRDITFPPLAVKEIKAGSCVLSTQTSTKIRERYNGLNRGLWGSTPGLLANLQPDRRRRYREEIAGIHQHQGSFCPDGSGGVFGDGACLTDGQAIGFVSSLWEVTPIVSGTPPVLDTGGYVARPNRGVIIHATADLSAGWVRCGFRRSIPAGCGALLFRVGLHPSFDATFANTNPTQRLLASVEVVESGGADDIVTRVYCGPHAEVQDISADDNGFCEIEPQIDPAYLITSDPSRKGWNRDSQISQAELSARKMLQFPYRVSEPIVAELTYPVQRPDDPYRPTQDYDVRFYFKMVDDAGAADTAAGLLWIHCRTAPGY